MHNVTVAVLIIVWIYYACIAVPFEQILYLNIEMTYPISVSADQWNKFFLLDDHTLEMGRHNFIHSHSSKFYPDTDSKTTLGRQQSKRLSVPEKAN